MPMFKESEKSEFCYFCVTFQLHLTTGRVSELLPQRRLEQEGFQTELVWISFVVSQEETIFTTATACQDIFPWNQLLGPT